MPKKKAYDLEQITTLLGDVQEKSDDIAKRLEVIYGLGPALEERDVGELGEILEAVSDVIDDFQYSLATYMAGTGIEFEEEEEVNMLQKPEELSGLDKFIENKLDWDEEEEDEEEDDDEEEEENEFAHVLDDEEEEEEEEFLR